MVSENREKRQKKNENALYDILNTRENVTRRQKVATVWRLSVPAIVAQLTSIVMQYIDAAMVGGLGADASAAIGVVSTTTWLMGGMSSAVSMGFAVQVAQQIGADNHKEARKIFKNSIGAAIIFSLVLAAIGIAIHTGLPRWLGSESSVWKDASGYFLVYACSLPLIQLNRLAGDMLRSSGNMKIPSILNGSMCILDIIFNFFFIGRFGVIGAAIGTALAELVIAILMMWFACVRSSILSFRKSEGWQIELSIIKKAIKLGAPLGLEHTALCGAMVVSTRIIAPLGNIAIAAHSFAITAESLCYMPGYGIGSAATTLVGQSIGAKKKELARSFSQLSIGLGCGIMTLTAVIMFFLSPFVFSLLTPVPQVQALATTVLRIELFAEPFYAASIVASGALQGAGDTLIPSIMNLCSIWGVRLVISILLVGPCGLQGAWIAMAIELCVRGLLLLYRSKKIFKWR